VNLYIRCYNIGHKGCKLAIVTSIKGANILVDNKRRNKLAGFGASKKVVKLATISEAPWKVPLTGWLQRSFVRRFIS
jgi:hypothetical protein